MPGNNHYNHYIAIWILLLPADGLAGIKRKEAHAPPSQG